MTAFNTLEVVSGMFKRVRKQHYNFIDRHNFSKYVLPQTELSFYDQRDFNNAVSS